MVWADEFNGSSIDRSVWSFGTGSTNDNIHYYTDRTDNAQVTGGELQIIARKESYQGYSYTSALVQSRHVISWRHGRIEARIKLPGGAGFVPAFWMMPEDDMYGWWPNSGEIDIMEYPTTQAGRIYGTAHAGAYSSYTGTAPKSASVQVPDAETAFHVYAIEWSADTIAYYVDQSKYFTVTNDHGGPHGWPFDQPFYIIVNLAVGGAWVGNPTPSTVFPAMMEVDYVRVYQMLDDLLISGEDFVKTSAAGIQYSVPQLAGATYTWSVPATAQLTSGQGTHQCAVTWGSSGGSVAVTTKTLADSVASTYPVVVSNSLLRNSAVEKGVKYWNTNVSPPAAAAFTLDSTAGIPGNHWMRATVSARGTNPWDVQITQAGFSLESGKQYEARVHARADSNGRSFNASVINAQTYAFLGGTTFTLSDTWKEYTFRCTPGSVAAGMFTMDVGAKTGVYFLDDISLTNLSGQNGLPDPGGEQTPDRFALLQNYPNPFNPTTAIPVAVPKQSDLTLEVFTILGQRVRTLWKGPVEAGISVFAWDARDDAGLNVASGTYLCRLSVGGQSSFSRRMLLLR